MTDKVNFSEITPCGGINLNEASTDAVLRELREETGYEFEIDRLVFIQERYYSLKDCRQQNVDVNIDNGTKTDQQSEHLHWLPIDELDITNLVPAFLKTALKKHT